MEAIEQFPIRNRWTDAVMFTAEISVTADMLPSVKLGFAIKWATKEGKNLSNADLSGADLSRAYLRYANLSRANLSRANLSGAYLSYADLSGACLSGADLSRADLSYTNLSRAYLRYANLSNAGLSRANLSYADLSNADLSGADLSGADLSRANLSYADLSGADLSGAYLSYADLSRAKDAEIAIAQTRILPEGSLIGWKKCEGGVIVRLRIPEDSPRSHAFGRKCRAKFADVLEIIGANEARSRHDRSFIYRAGERVEAANWSEDWQEECDGGIHFFITRTEAELC